MMSSHVLIDECIILPEPENIARLMYFLYGEKYRCFSIKKKIWKVKNEERWVEIEQGYMVYSLISTEVMKHFEKALIETEQRQLELRRTQLDSDTLENHELLESMKLKISNCRKLCRLLKNTTFKNKVMKECAVLFYHQENI